MQKRVSERARSRRIASHLITSYRHSCNSIPRKIDPRLERRFQNEDDRLIVRSNLESTLVTTRYAIATEISRAYMVIEIQINGNARYMGLAIALIGIQILVMDFLQ